MAGVINGTITIRPHLAAAMAGATKHGGMETRWTQITPELAKEWLEKNNKRNRRLNPAIVARYVADMEKGDWLPTHQGIAFDCEDRLADGQHRLAAIAAHSKPVWMLVTTGLPDNAIEAIDRNQKRSVAQTLQIMGFSLASSRAVATARVMISGPSDSFAAVVAMNDQEMKRFISKHQEALAFALALPKTQANVSAVFARAFYHHDHERLRRFWPAYDDKIQRADLRPGDGSARKLCGYLKGSKQAGGSQRAEIYRKAQAALWHYLQGHDLGQLRENTNDLFPLPEETPLLSPEGA